MVGAGPNGLAAAITLARAGKSVVVFEAAERVGGGARSAELTLPGFTHDVCSAIYGVGAGAPFFQTIPLAEHGLEWILPPVPLAHPLDDGSAVFLERSVEETAEGLGADGPAYRRLMAPFARRWDELAGEVLAPLRPPRHPLLMARFGMVAVRSGYAVAHGAFRGERARALLAGLVGHSMLPLERRPSAGFGVFLALSAHATGWPVARGGAQKLADALASYLKSLGGEVVTGRRVESVDDLPPSRALLLDVTPRQVVSLAGRHLPGGFTRRLERYRYGPGVFKVDWALDGPVPWRASECARAGTVHVGGTIEEIAAAERAVWKGVHPERPYVLVAQQSLFDPSRAPGGKQTLWGYCHVPNGSTFDMAERIEAQIERFAPGFRDRVMARSVMSPARMEEYNANYVGGDINGGVQDLGQLFSRPVWRLSPYTTPHKRIYICSSSTPPGGGVHGMCGYHAARAALRRSLACSDST